MNPVLSIENLQVSLGGKKVLTDVNLQLQPGTFTALLGPNGAGKTTLLRTILGVQKKNAGKIRLDNNAQIGYVPQRHSFAWDYPVSVAEVVLGGLRLRPWQMANTQRYRQVYDALEKVNLLELENRHIGALSGGQRQRVLLARALVRNPQLLILDEPFTGLDVPTSEELTTLFRHLTQQGAAIFMSSHDLVGAIERCDQLVLLNKTILGHDEASGLADPQLWASTFGVPKESTLVRTVGAFLDFNDHANTVKG